MSEVRITSGINLNVNKPTKHVAPKKIFRNTKSLEDLKKQVKTAISKVGGKFVQFDNIDHTEGLMLAGIIDDTLDDNTNQDKVCFAIMDRDKKVVYVNNNEHFSVLQNIPSSLYILNYLYTHEPETLLDYAEHAFDKDKVDLFTKICISIPKKKTNKKNNKK